MKAVLREDGVLELKGSFAEMLPIRNQLEAAGCRVERIEVQPVRTRALTGRQHSILLWISLQIDRNGVPPTIREIGNAFGITSTNGVNDHLKVIESKGWIQRGNNRSSRSIKILRRP